MSETTVVHLLRHGEVENPDHIIYGRLSGYHLSANGRAMARAAVQFGRRANGQARATLTGFGAGLVFGIQDAFTRQTLEVLEGGHPWTGLFTTWSAYALVGAGITGIWLMQNAFSAAPLHASLPTIAAGEPLAGIVLGIVVFGDRIQISPGPLAIEAGGIAALIVGVIMVARSSAFGGLHKVTEAIKPDLVAQAAHAKPVSHVSPPGLADRQGGLRRRRAASRAYRRQLHGPASGGEGG